MGVFRRLPDGTSLSGDQELTTLGAPVQERPLARGAVLFRTGAPCRAVYRLETGSILSHIDLPSGDSQLVAYHLPGELIGIDLPDAGELHSATTIALESCTVGAVASTSWRDLFVSNPEFASRQMQCLREQARNHRAHVMILGRPHALQRVGMFLVELSRRWTLAGGNGHRLPLSIPHRDIANLLGLAPETVCRVLTSLRLARVVATDRRSIGLLDVERLGAIAMGTDRERLDALRLPIIATSQSRMRS